jgi:hypothetical protein
MQNNVATITGVCLQNMACIYASYSTKITYFIERIVDMERDWFPEFIHGLAPHIASRAHSGGDMAAGVSACVRAVALAIPGEV